LKTGEKLNITKQTGAFQPSSDLTEDSVRNRDFAADKLLDNGSFSFSENVESHTVTIVGKGLNKLRSHSCNHRVCATMKAKNLELTTAQNAVVGEKPQQIRAKIMEFGFHLQKAGYAVGTVKTYMRNYRCLINLGADLADPESVKEVIARQN
jgi:hypothetical protein